MHRPPLCKRIPVAQDSWKESARDRAHFPRGLAYSIRTLKTCLGKTRKLDGAARKLVWWQPESILGLEVNKTQHVQQPFWGGVEPAEHGLIQRGFYSRVCTARPGGQSL